MTRARCTVARALLRKLSTHPSTETRACARTPVGVPLNRVENACRPSQLPPAIRRGRQQRSRIGLGTAYVRLSDRRHWVCLRRYTAPALGRWGLRRPPCPRPCGSPLACSPNEGDAVGAFCVFPLARSGPSNDRHLAGSPLRGGTSCVVAAEGPRILTPKGLSLDPASDRRHCLRYCGAAIDHRELRRLPARDMSMKRAALSTQARGQWQE
jgi:hypothetical protein